MSELTSALSSAVGAAASTFSGGILGPVLSIIDKIIPDPAAKAAAQLAVLQLNQQGQLQEESNQLQLALAQTTIDNTEASSDSLFRAGWRPFVGWTCASGLCYSFLLAPIGGWLCKIWLLPAPPTLDLSTLLPLLGSLLGLGAMRTYEKVQGATQTPTKS